MSCADRKQTIFATTSMNCEPVDKGLITGMLYFFSEGRAVLSHGLTKEGKVPDTEIDRAVERKRRFEQSPDKHTYRE